MALAAVTVTVRVNIPDDSEKDGITFIKKPQGSGSLPSSSTSESNGSQLSLPWL